MIEYKYLEIINAAAMKAESINSDGTFVFKDANIAKLFRSDAEKNKIPYDEASALNEFKIDNTNIIIYPDFERAVLSLPLFKNFNKEYCYYSKDEKKIIILRFDENNNPVSFYFSDEKNLGTKKNCEFSLSNIVYWQKIYELLCDKISDSGAESNRSFSITSFENGKCFFSYSNYNSSFNNKDLKTMYSRLSEILELTHLYPMIFKNRCVERLAESKNSTFDNLVSELEEICNKVETDFAIFVEKFEFDNYIQKYNERFAEFISQSRNIIEKIMSNIFTLPLTFAGAIFTLDKLDDNSFAPYIFSAMCCYAVFSCVFLIYEFIDTFSINKSFNKELNDYTHNSLILKEKVKPDIKSINCRIIGIRIACFFLISIFITLTIILGIKYFKN